MRNPACLIVLAHQHQQRPHLGHTRRDNKAAQANCSPEARFRQVLREGSDLYYVTIEAPKALYVSNVSGTIVPQ